jgi:bifunctional oligoribonuclease and PAP phosphatase NrnA
MMNTNEQIHDKIKQAERIAVAAHIRPDGDAIGSVLGLGLALKEQGKTVQFVFPDSIPTRFQFLPGADCITKKLEVPIDLAILVDCADLERSGGVFGERVVDINIDHHKTNTNFACLNLIDPFAAATAEILTKHLPEWGLFLSKSVADALLTGVVTDSQGFATSNTTSATLRFAGVLVDAGAALASIYAKVVTEKDFHSARLWGLGLSKLKQEGGVVWTSITQADRKETNYQGNDDADLVNLMATITEAKVCLLFNEQQNGHTKISWRSKPEIDISILAEEFGGGGHRSAAGAEIKDTLNRTQTSVLDRTKKYLEENFEQSINPS